jgi:hypothetical protein
MIGNVKRFAAVLLAFGSAACTFNIKPVVPAVPSASGAARLNCSVLLLVPQEFATREYISSFDGREIRLLIGPPTTEAIENLLKARFVEVNRQNTSGDGTLDFVRLSSRQQSPSNLIARPRFARLESSVRPFRYNIEFGLVLDVAGLNQLVTLQGDGIGTAGLYVQSEIQKAADEALSQMISSLSANLPLACK